MAPDEVQGVPVLLVLLVLEETIGLAVADQAVEVPSQEEVLATEIPYSAQSLVEYRLANLKKEFLISFLRRSTAELSNSALQR